MLGRDQPEGSQAVIMVSDLSAPTEQQKTVSSDEDQGWASSLSMKVMDNIQFFIEKVHIRFEDVRSVEGKPFALGFTLDHLHIESANSNWEPSFNSVGEAVKHKVSCD